MKIVSFPDILILTLPNKKRGILTEPYGVPSTRNEYDGWGYALFTPNHKPFTVIGYVNESGTCFYLISPFKNGFKNSLTINSNEDGYIYGFGELVQVKKTGRWILNQHTGESFLVSENQNDLLTGQVYFFEEDQLIGTGSYLEGELLNCEGSCE